MEHTRGFRRQTTDSDDLMESLVLPSLTSSAEELTAMQKRVPLQHLFQEGRRLVMLQGSSGMGKSTLSKRLCEAWVKGEAWMGGFHLVFLVEGSTVESQQEVMMDIVSMIHQFTQSC